MGVGIGVGGGEKEGEGGSLLVARVTARACAALDLRVGQVAWLQVKSVALLQ
jgi:ABC-type molybdate transport system ATPase subunit